MTYLVLSEPPFETDDIDVVLEMQSRGVKIYKPVMFKTLEGARSASFATQETK